MDTANALKNDASIERLVRFEEVSQRTGLGRSSMYRAMQEGKFPRPLKLGAWSVAWRESAINAWVAEKIAAAGEQ